MSLRPRRSVSAPQHQILNALGQGLERGGSGQVLDLDCLSGVALGQLSRSGMNLVTIILIVLIVLALGGGGYGYYGGGYNGIGGIGLGGILIIVLIVLLVTGRL